MHPPVPGGISRERGGARERKREFLEREREKMRDSISVSQNLIAVVSYRVTVPENILSIILREIAGKMERDRERENTK